MFPLTKIYQNNPPLTITYGRGVGEVQTHRDHRACQGPRVLAHALADVEALVIRGLVECPVVIAQGKKVLAEETMGVVQAVLVHRGGEEGDDFVGELFVGFHVYAGGDLDGRGVDGEA